MIYFVEDDDNIRKLICYALGKEGYDVKGFALPGEFYDESRTLDVHTRKFRVKLDSAGELIQMVKNIGYKMGGLVNE